MATVVTSSPIEQQRNKNGNSSNCGDETQTSLAPSTSGAVVYDVEHLATFSTTGSHETSTAQSNNRLAPNDVGGGGGRSGSSRSGSNNAETSTPKSLNATTNTRTTPKVALQRLFELEKQSGIWTQRMQIELQDDLMLIVDCETNLVVERFNRECVTKPEAFNEYNDIYNNIVVFTILQTKTAAATRLDENSRESDTDQESSSTSSKIEEGELHIFQCVSHKAEKLVSDILAWKEQAQNTSICDSTTSKMANSTSEKESSRSSQQDNKKSSKHDQDQKEASLNHKSSSSKSDSITAMKQKQSKISPSLNGSSVVKPNVTVLSSSSTGENVPIVNVNVKETVQVFNQIAALREKR